MNVSSFIRIKITIFLPVSLGVYTTAYEKGWTRKSDGSVSIMRSALFGGIGGTLGQFIASPFFMVRNQLQSAAVEKIAVGYQHKHASMTGALMKIYQAQGIKGLYRGSLVTFPRGMMGSGSQIAAFGYTKDLLQRKSNLDATMISFLSGCVAATVQTIVMNPTGIKFNNWEGFWSKNFSLQMSSARDSTIKEQIRVDRELRIQE